MSLSTDRGLQSTESGIAAAVAIVAAEGYLGLFGVERRVAQLLPG